VRGEFPANRVSFVHNEQITLLNLSCLLKKKYNRLNHHIVFEKFTPFCLNARFHAFNLVKQQKKYTKKNDDIIVNSGNYIFTLNMNSNKISNKVHIALFFVDFSCMCSSCFVLNSFFNVFFSPAKRIKTNCNPLIIRKILTG
jgi:hypothetical protein